MTIPFYLIDAFTGDAPDSTDRPGGESGERPKGYNGNPAGVCLLPNDPGPAADAWMQAVAAEMNQAETAFTWREASADGASPTYRLRWFTPRVEVDLCGHATLATAHALHEAGLLTRAGVRFQTKSGLLTVLPSDDYWCMDFPAELLTLHTAPTELLESLGVPATAVRTAARTRFDWFLELTSVSAVGDVRPDFRALGQVATRGVIVTAAAGAGDIDFVSRFFAPQVGIDEDPVTGSAHCALGPFWSQRLGKPVVTGYQASPRGGRVTVTPQAENRVTLAGHARTMVVGTLQCPPPSS